MRYKIIANKTKKILAIHDTFFLQHWLGAEEV